MVNTVLEDYIIKRNTATRNGIKFLYIQCVKYHLDGIIDNSWLNYYKNVYTVKNTLNYNHEQMQSQAYTSFRILSVIRNIISQIKIHSTMQSQQHNLGLTKDRRQVGRTNEHLSLKPGHVNM